MEINFRVTFPTSLPLHGSSGLLMPENAHKKQVHAFFNSANAYLTGNMTTEFRKQLITQMLGQIENKKIIDIGCGNGSVSIPFLGTNNVTFLDFSINMLKEVEKKVPSEFKENYECFHGDVESFQPVIKFDIAIVLGLLAHVENLNRTVKKISELLKPAGVCIVQITNSQKNITKIINLLSRIKRLISKPNYQYTVNDLNEKGIVHAFGENDLKLIQKKVYLSSFPGFKLIPEKLRKDFLLFLNGKEVISKFGSEMVLKFEKI